MKKLMLLGAIFGSGLIAYNCGSGGASSGTVALYITDDKLDGAQKVEVLIKEIRMENSGSGLSCTVFSPDTPYAIDLTDVQNTLQLLDTTNCPEGQYNRLVVVMEQSPVNVIYLGQAYTCSLTTYDPEMDNSQVVKPNRTVCDNSAGECFIEVTGAVNVLASQNNEVALDFELKDSDINFDNSGNCTVAFKVSPIHADGMKTAKQNKEEEIKGTVSNLDVNNNTFTLTTKAGMAFSVSYSNDSYDDLLQLAEAQGLPVEVECQTLDINNATCTAGEIELEVEGVALNVDATNGTLTVDRDGDTSTTNDQIPVALAQNGEWEGNIQDGSLVEVKIVGFDGNNYIAKEVEQEM